MQPVLLCAVRCAATVHHKPRVLPLVSEPFLIALAGLIVLGVAAQWLAWRLGMASILLLLVVGFIAGPVSAKVLGRRLLDPDALLGEALLPFVSLSVALILYEGGLTLRVAQLGEARAVVGRLIAATPNDWVNVLAVHRFRRVFGRGEVYQVPTRKGTDSGAETHRHLHGRWLFDEQVTHDHLAQRVAAGAVVKATLFTEVYTMESFREHYGEQAIALFVVTESGRLEVITAGSSARPQPGETLISLVDDPRGAPGRDDIGTEENTTPSIGTEGE